MKDSLIVEDRKWKNNKNYLSIFKYIIKIIDPSIKNKMYILGKDETIEYGMIKDGMKSDKNLLKLNCEEDFRDIFLRLKNDFSKSCKINLFDVPDYGPVLEMNIGTLNIRFDSYNNFDKFWFEEEFACSASGKKSVR